MSLLRLETRGVRNRGRIQASEGWLVEVERDDDAYVSENDKITEYQEIAGYCKDRWPDRSWRKIATAKFKEKHGHYPPFA